MNPCPFVRLIVESLALKLSPPATTGAGAGNFCTVHLHPSSLPPQTTPLPTVVVSDDVSSCLSSTKLIFHVDPSSIRKAMVTATTTTTTMNLILSVHVDGTGSTTCMGRNKAALVRKVNMSIDLKVDETIVYRTGWIPVDKGGTQLHMVVRSEPDPRYVFQFGGEPECSPVVYQVQERSGGGCGSARQQPVFSCRFNAHRQSTGSNRSLPSDTACKSRSSCNGCCFFPLGTGRQDLRARRGQRKGWTVTIHDLSGSPVAAAAMITPFVPSPGSHSVSRSNPGAWLILRPNAGFPAANAWSPWGRLEAWRERIPGGHALGYRLELVVDPNAAGIPIAESKLSVRKGGEFRIDTGTITDNGKECSGFVMGSTTEGQGKVSRPTVQVGAQHVRCMADAAVFVALSAAVDLSMDACRLFSGGLRKELCRDRRNYV